MTPQTLIGIGSITKSLTAFGIMKLVERDKLSLEDSVSQFLNFAPFTTHPDIMIKHILDISTPATYGRYSGSPTGSVYDMAPYTNNFGRTRLKMRTPIEGLFQPKFVHGVFGCLLAGMQVNDMILNGKIMNGYARYTP
jgi:CubicO group peptidase (beta-lactamase class C family)